MANQRLQFQFRRNGSHNSNGIENHEGLNWQVGTRASYPMEGTTNHNAEKFGIANRKRALYSLWFEVSPKSKH